MLMKKIRQRTDKITVLDNQIPQYTGIVGQFSDLFSSSLLLTKLKDLYT